MELSNVREVFEHDGPFATVYLEGRSPGEDSGEQMRLRWRALRERLEQAGAGSGAVDAIESALLAGEAGEQQTNGRVLVATEHGVVLDEPWDAALGAGDDAHWSTLPELGAYVREAAHAVRALVVITDQQGARLRQEVIAEQHEPREVGADDVEGGAREGTHKPRQGALSHNQIQRRADEAVGRNARDIVEHVRRAASKFRPRVLVLAGEVQGRTAVREELPEQLGNILVETEQGGSDEHSHDDALADELLRIAAEESSRRAQNVTETLRTGQAHEQATVGEKSVTLAAEQGAVDTLLLHRGIPAEREVALLKSCAATGATVDLVSDDTELPDGVGALLRFPVRE